MERGMQRDRRAVRAPALQEEEPDSQRHVAFDPSTQASVGGRVFRNWARLSCFSVRLAQMPRQQPRTEPRVMCRPAM